MKTIYTNCLDLSWKMSKYLFSQTWLLFQNRMEKKKLSVQTHFSHYREIGKRRWKRGKESIEVLDQTTSWLIPTFPFHQREREITSLPSFTFQTDWLTVTSKTGLLIGLSSTQGFEGLKECKEENFTGTCVSPFELGPLQSRSVIINCKL